MCGIGGYCGTGGGIGVAEEVGGGLFYWGLDLLSSLLACATLRARCAKTSISLRHGSQDAVLRMGCGGCCLLRFVFVLFNGTHLRNRRIFVLMENARRASVAT